MCEYAKEDRDAAVKLHFNKMSLMEKMLVGVLCKLLERICKCTYCKKMSSFLFSCRLPTVHQIGLLKGSRRVVDTSHHTGF